MKVDQRAVLTSTIYVVGNISFIRYSHISHTRCQFFFFLSCGLKVDKVFKFIKATIVITYKNSRIKCYTSNLQIYSWHKMRDVISVLGGDPLVANLHLK